MENTLLEITAVLIGFLLRLGIPIGLTFLLSLYLKWLDRRWQAEADTAAAAKTALYAHRKPCWEIHNCPPRMRNTCKAYAHPKTPCWELFRVNGNLKPACRTCKLPPPALA